MKRKMYQNVLKKKRHVKTLKKKDGYNCCWYKGIYEGLEDKGCIPVKMTEFDKTLENVKDELDDDNATLECSGKYLYVASLLLLFFVF